MKIKCINSVNIDLTLNKIYEVIEIEKWFGRDYYRIIDDSGDDYDYGTNCFEVVEN